MTFNPALLMRLPRRPTLLTATFWLTACLAFAQAPSVPDGAAQNSNDRPTNRQSTPEDAKQATEGDGQADARRANSPGGLFFLSSPLQRAIRRGMRPGGNLADELEEFEYFEISTRKDARAVCAALAQLPFKRPTAAERADSDDGQADDGQPDDRRDDEQNDVPDDSVLLSLLVSLFENIESFEAPAFAVLRDEGIPELVRIYDVILSRGDPDDADDLLHVLEILTMYESQAGADRIIQAVRTPLAPDSYHWANVFQMVALDTKYRESIYRSLSETPPTGYAAVALLDSANGQAVEGHLPRHPFSTKEGAARLAQLLQDTDPDHASYAHSAAVAIPWLDREYQDPLLPLAAAHPNGLVRLEAGRAAAKLGRESGLEVLKQFSLDVHLSKAAVQYLEELKRGDLIPAAAKDPEFRARAEFSDWVAGPAELGRPPAELTVVDRRQLAWPPEKKPQEYFIVRSRSVDPNGLDEDDVKVGVVGERAWRIFDKQVSQRPPDDIYAIHFVWQQEQTGLIQTTVVDNPTVYAPMLAQWTGETLESPRIEMLAKLADPLGYASKRVAIATAQRGGQEGWVVLDGPRSSWYPKSEQPQETATSTLLQIHLGRHLLGLLEPVDRTSFLTPASPVRPPQEVIAAYEKLINDLPSAKPSRQEELLSWHGPLADHLDRYVESVVQVRGGTPDDVRITTYERLLKMSAETDPSIRRGLLDSYSFVGQHFESYVAALMAVGRKDEAAAVVERIAKQPEFDLELDALGKAAFQADRRELAERLLDKFRRESETYYFSESMACLAEIWYDRGERQRAQDLLLDCLRKVAKDIQDNDYEFERDALKKVFDRHRATYVKLFPDGVSEIPEIDVQSVAE